MRVADGPGIKPKALGDRCDGPESEPVGAVFMLQSVLNWGTINKPYGGGNS